MLPTSRDFEPATFALFDLWPGAALLLAADGRLLRCTPTALRMLEHAGCVERGSNGELAFAVGGTQQALAAALQRCIEQRVPVPCPLLPRTRVLGDALVLHAHALETRGDGPATGAAAVVVVALLSTLQPDRDAKASEATVRAVLGLTHGEARVAFALHEHADVTLAARALCTAPGTARSHLKRIYQKLHLNRQGELILLVERCLAGAAIGGVGPMGGSPRKP